MHKRLSRAVGVAAAFVLLAGGTADATIVFTTGFETSDTATTFSGAGASRDCSYRYEGTCSVKIDPPGATAVNSHTPVNVTMSGVTTVSFVFEGDNVNGDVDSSATILLNDGSVNLDVSSMWNPNTGIVLNSAGFPSTPKLTNWPTALTWYPVTITLDPVAHTVSASVLGASGSTQIAADATTITAVEFGGIRWSSYGWPFHYDALQIDTGNTPPTTTNQSPADGTHYLYNDNISFTVNATDPQGDTYRPTVEVWAADNGSLVGRYDAAGMTASGLPATVSNLTFPSGGYQWDAYSTDSHGAVGPPSARQTFVVNRPSTLQGTWVSLGDSYSSGEGVPAYPVAFAPGSDDPGVNECHRSELSYPRIVHRIYGGIDVPNPMVWYPCSGAETRNFFNTRQWPNEPPQFSHLDDTPDATLVTFSIGGNDSGFGPILQNCITRLSGLCSTDPAITDPLARRFARLEAGVNTYPSQADLNADGDLLNVRPYDEVFQSVRLRAPNARVIVVGYPKFFPDGGVFYPCNAVFQPDQIWMNQKVHDLDDIIRRHADKYGFEYLDVENAFASHHLCESDPWMNGILATDTHYMFHPNWEGHWREAQLLATQILIGANVVPCTPTQPLSLTAGAPAQDQATSLALTWTAPTSTCDVQYYQVLRNGVEVPSTSTCYRPATPGCTDTGLIGSTSYAYTVRAVSTVRQGSLNGDLSATANATTAATTCVPGAPTGVVTSSPWYAGLTVSFTPHHNGCTLRHYRVYRSNDQAGPWVEVPTGSSCYRYTLTSCIDSGLPAGFTVWYEVTEVSSQGDESAPSTPVSGTTAPECVPGQPTAVTTTGASSTSVSVSWTANHNGCSLGSYTLYRSTTQYGAYDEVPSSSGCYRTQSNPCTDSGLTTGVTYWYMVGEYSTTASLSALSVPVSGTPLPPPCTPNAPSTPTLTKVDSATLSVAWTPNHNGCTTSQYRVYRSIGGNSNFVEVTSGSCNRPTTTSCTDTGLSPGLLYWYKASEVSIGTQESTLSNWVYGTPGCVSNAPTGYAIAPPSQQGALTFSWTPNHNGCTASYYLVQRSTTANGPYTDVLSPSACYHPTTASCTDTGLAAATTYYYIVYEVSSTGVRNPFPTAPGASATTLPPPCTPNAPTSVTATGATTSSLNVAWTPNHNGCTASYYKVLRGSAAGGPFTEVTSGGCNRPTAASCTDSGLAVGTAYWYVVVEVSTSLDPSAQSAAGSGATLAPCTPNAPTSIGVGSATPSSLAVSWTANHNGCTASHFRVYRSTTQTGTYTEVASGGCYRPTATPCTDSGLAANTPYWYKVSEFSTTSNESLQSAAATGTTLPTPCMPSAPTLVTPGSPTPTSLTVTWTANHNGCTASYYRVFRSTTQNGTYTEVASGGCYRQGTTSCTDAGLNNSTVYWYKVSEVSTTGHESAQSTAWTGTTTPANDAFGSSIATLSQTSWSNVESTVGATTEANEPTFPNPSCTTSSTQATVWWRFTPPESGLYQVDTVGTNFDTVLSVYTGSTLTGLTRLDCNDDLGNGSVQSKLLLTLMGGTTYQIQVGGFTGGTGALVLNGAKVNVNGTPAGFASCGAEGAQCNLGGSAKDMAFGAHGTFVVKTGLTGKVTCSVATFGKDPDPGFAKSCYTVSAGGGGLVNGYASCAAEGATCPSWTGTKSVAFGNTHGTYALLTGVSNGTTFPCKVSAFWDSDPGFAKSCYTRT